MTGFRRIVLIGQAPSRTSDPGRPLTGAAISGKLRKMLGVSEAAYDVCVEKINLLQKYPGKAGKGDKFDTVEARRQAAKIAPSLEGASVIFLGRKVAAAFGFGAMKPLLWRLDAARRVSILPHPSGVCQWYNDPENRARARRFMRRAWRSTCDVAPGTSRYSCSHRVAWVKASGPIPPGKNVCHHCDVSRCKNDRHLFLATQAENLRDMDSKDRRRSRSVPRFGENNPGNKLTVKDVRAIRKASARGVKDAAQAKKYGVAKTAIGAILLGRTWKGVV